MGVLGATDVHFSSPSASCHYVIPKPPEVPLAGIESREYEQGWSWLPPGLTCRTLVDGREVVVREPTWRSTAWPLVTLAVSVGVTAAAIGWTVHARWLRELAVGGRVIAGLAAIAQPLVLITLLAALVLPDTV